MIKYSDKSKCCGCSACVQKCPKHCISLISDSEGFSYPIIDIDNCVDCGICEKVCPEINMSEEKKPLSVFAAINADTTVRQASSSGGVFTSLAKQILAMGGIVFGAKFTEEWQVKIDYTENEEGLSLFRGSKYVQALVGDSYIKCELYLKQGRKVLFSATPCIISGLNQFLNKKYDNLLTIDVACHGAPSPGVWQEYLKCTIKDACMKVDGISTELSFLNAMSLIKDVKFREKTLGWHKYRIVFNIAVPTGDGNRSFEQSFIHDENPYFKAFNNGVILRPSCYECKIKNACRSNSDLTLADFWGIECVDSTFDDNKGTSLVLVNSEKGYQAFKNANLITEKSSYSIAIQYNSGLRTGSYKHPNRKSFFNRYNKNVPVIPLLVKAMKPTLTMRMVRICKAIIIRSRKLLCRDCCLLL